MTRKHHEEPGQDQPAPQPSADAPTAPQALDTAKLRTERDDLLARLQRLSADYLNYQKRAARDVESAREFANEALIRALLPVLDDLERALTAAKTNHAADDPLLAGVELVLQKAAAVLGQFGVTAIDPKGQPFDPAKHLALMQRPSDAPAMTILEALQKGYQLRGRVIRPASVVVSQGSAPAKEPTAGDEAENPDD